MAGYIEDSFAEAPLLLTGDVGSGKSSLMAKCAKVYITRQKQESKTDSRNAQDTSTLPAVRHSTDRLLSAHSDPQQPRNWSLFRPNKPPPSTSLLQEEGEEDLSSVESVPLLEPLPEQQQQQQHVAVDTWHVFYHFIGSVPYSADLRHILQRLWFIESLGEPKVSPVPTESNALAKEVLDMLSKRGRKKYLIFIDGVDRVGL